MANAETFDPNDDVEPQKSSKKGLIVGLALGLCAAGGGFYAVSSGLILAPEETAAASGDPTTDAALDGGLPVALDDIAFVPIEPITVSLGVASGAEHLRFRGELEVPPGERAQVEKVLPRIIDVLNGYLRAVEPAHLREPDSLPRLRAQMLRRVRLVVGESRVNDLLIMEFIVK